MGTESRVPPGSPEAALRAGGRVWAEYRRRHPGPVDLRGIRLWNVTVNESTLHRPDSVFQRFRTLDRATVDLSDVDLRGTYLREIRLAGADLRRVDLRGATLRGVDARAADLSGSDLRDTDLVGCSLAEADLADARLGGTYLGVSTLLGARGLDHVRVDARCVADPFTVVTGVDADRPWPDRLAEAFALPDGLRRLAVSPPSRPLPRCFVSYRSTDEELVERLHDRLVDRRVPAWYAPSHLRQRLLTLRGEGTDEHEAEIRRSLFEFVDAAHVVLVVVTDASTGTGSEWVEREVSRARDGHPLIALLAEDVATFPPWLSARRPAVMDIRDRLGDVGLDSVADQLVAALGAASGDGVP